MDSFELNRIFAAIIGALLIGILVSKFSDIMIDPQLLSKEAFPIIVAEETTSTTSTSAVEESQAAPIEPLLVSANVAHGQDVAKKCLQCHSLEKDGPNKIGPNLWGIVGNKVAHSPTYAYSTVFKEKGGTWTYAELNDFLYHPQKHMPGTKMTYGGAKNTQDRADLIAYLRTLSDTPVELPKS